MGPTFGGLMAASLLLGQAGDIQLVQGVTGTYGAYGPAVPQQGMVQETPQNQSRGFFGMRSRIQGWFGRGNNQTPNQYNQGQYNQGTYPYSTTTQGGTVISPNGTVMSPSGTVISPAPGQTVVSPGGSVIIGQPPISTTPTTIVPGNPSSTMPGAEYHRRMPTTSGKVIIGDGKVEQAGSYHAGGLANNVPSSTPTVEVQANYPILPCNMSKIGRDEKFAWVTGQYDVENGAIVLYYATPDTVDDFHGKLVLQTQADLSQFRRGDLVTAEGTVMTPSGPRGLPVYRAMHVNLVEHPQR